MIAETVKHSPRWDEDWSKIYGYDTYCPNCHKAQTVYIKKGERVASQIVVCERCECRIKNP